MVVINCGPEGRLSFGRRLFELGDQPDHGADPPALPRTSVSKGEWFSLTVASASSSRGPGSRRPRGPRPTVAALRHAPARAAATVTADAGGGICRVRPAMTAAVASVRSTPAAAPRILLRPCPETRSGDTPRKMSPHTKQAHQEAGRRIGVRIHLQQPGREPRKNQAHRSQPETANEDGPGRN